MAVSDGDREVSSDDDRSTDDGPALRVDGVRHPSGTVVLHLTGAIDECTAPGLSAELDRWAGERTDVVLDLSGVDHLGTAGLASLLRARDDLDAEGHRLRVAVGGSGPARRALQVSGAMERLEVLDRIPDDPPPQSGLLFPVPD